MQNYPAYFDRYKDHALFYGGGFIEQMKYQLKGAIERGRMQMVVWCIICRMQSCGNGAAFTPSLYDTLEAGAIAQSGHLCQPLMVCAAEVGQALWQGQAVAFRPCYGANQNACLDMVFPGIATGELFCPDFKTSMGWVD